MSSFLQTESKLPVSTPINTPSPSISPSPYQTQKQNHPNFSLQSQLSSNTPFSATPPSSLLPTPSSNPKPKLKTQPPNLKPSPSLSSQLQHSSSLSKPDSLRLPSINPSQNPNPQRQSQIRRLTLQNKKLLLQLKFLNDKLTQIITKQSTRSRSIRKPQPTSPSSSITHKTLTQTYKQLQTYKKLLQKHKQSEPPLQQFSKITDLSNKLKATQGELKLLKKEVAAVDEIREKQEKEIVRTETEGPKGKMVKLQGEIQESKEELRGVRKEGIRLEEVGREQHEYLVWMQRLEKELKGKEEKGRNKEKEKEKEKQVTEIKEQEWELLKVQLEKAREVNKEIVKKMEVLKRHKLGEEKGWERVEGRMKERGKQLVMVEKKYHDTKVLMVTMRHGGRQREKDKSLGGSVRTGGKMEMSSLLHPHPSETHLLKPLPTKTTIHTIGSPPPLSLHPINFSDYSKFPDKVLKIKLIRLTLYFIEGQQRGEELYGIQGQYLLNGHKEVEGNTVGKCGGEGVGKKIVELREDEIVNVRGGIDGQGRVWRIGVEMRSGKVVEVRKQKNNVKNEELNEDHQDEQVNQPTQKNSPHSTFSILGDQLSLQCLEGTYTNTTQGPCIYELKFHYSTSSLYNPS